MKRVRLEPRHLGGNCCRGRDRPELGYEKRQEWRGRLGGGLGMGLEKEED